MLPCKMRLSFTVFYFKKLIITNFLKGPSKKSISMVLIVAPASEVAAAMFSDDFSPVHVALRVSSSVGHRDHVVPVH